MVWAERDWVPAAERRRVRLAWVLLITLLGTGGALYIGGMIAWLSSAVSFALAGAGALILVITGFVGLAVLPYRRVNSEMVAATSTVFHISSADWAVGEVVTLEPAYCRKKQAIAERWWGRKARLVYFFPQRPTFRHARGQTLAGRRRAPRYLYELEVQHPIDALYGRGAALATPRDLRVAVIGRQELGSITMTSRR